MKEELWKLDIGSKFPRSGVWHRTKVAESFYDSSAIVKGCAGFSAYVKFQNELIKKKFSQ